MATVARPQCPAAHPCKPRRPAARPCPARQCPVATGKIRTPLRHPDSGRRRGRFEHAVVSGQTRSARHPVGRRLRTQRQQRRLPPPKPRRPVRRALSRPAFGRKRLRPRNAARFGHHGRRPLQRNRFGLRSAGKAAVPRRLARPSRPAGCRRQTLLRPHRPSENGLRPRRAQNLRHPDRPLLARRRMAAARHTWPRRAQNLRHPDRPIFSRRRMAAARHIDFRPMAATSKLPLRRTALVSRLLLPRRLRRRHRRSICLCGAALFLRARRPRQHRPHLAGRAVSPLRSPAPPQRPANPAPPTRTAAMAFRPARFLRRFRSQNLPATFPQSKSKSFQTA